jgi:diguanylate cyclase (GGDEF)-like protein
MLAERLRLLIAELSFKSGGKRFGITTSIGIASLPPGSAISSSQLIRMADEALYDAKHNGRNTISLADGPAEPVVLAN